MKREKMASHDLSQKDRRSRVHLEVSVCSEAVFTVVCPVFCVCFSVFPFSFH